MDDLRTTENQRDADCIGVLNLDKVKIDPACALRVPASLAVRRQMLPLAVHDGHGAAPEVLRHVADEHVVEERTSQKRAERELLQVWQAVDHLRSMIQVAR